MNKKITLMLLFTVNIIIAKSISGKIVDNNNQPLPSVDVLVKGASTDFDENFEITNISGNQVLVVSSIGYKTKEVSVTTSINNLVITLYEGNELLQEVVVASRNNSFSSKETAYVTKKNRAGIIANNFTDETYYSEWCTTNAQAPRSFLETFTYKFKNR